MCSRIQEREAESTSQAHLPASWHLARGQGWHGEVCRRQAACSHPASPPGAYLPISAGKVTRVTLPIVHPRNKTPLLPPLPRPSHFFISRLIAAFKSLTQILLCPALRSYPALAVVSGVDPRGKVLAARRAIRGLLPGVLCCAQGDKQGEGRGRAPGRSEPPAFPDPQPSPAPADSGTLGLAPGAVGGADLAWPCAARWHSKATPGHGRGMPRRKSSC